MTTMRQPLEEHPLLRCLASVEQALDDVAGLDPTYLPIGDKARALRAVDRELARLEGLRLDLLAASSDVATDARVRSAGVWLAGESRAGARPGCVTNGSPRRSATGPPYSVPCATVR
jgi:hypothetical protein